MSETGPAQQLFNVGNRTSAAAFCIGIRAGALDTAKIKTKNSEKLMKHCRMRISHCHVINSAGILLLAIHSIKMKQNVGIFCFAVLEQLRAELISK